MAPDNQNHNGKKGRFVRLGGGTTVLAAVILILLVKTYPLVPPPSLATLAVLIALASAALFNFLYERRRK